MGVFDEAHRLSSHVLLDAVVARQPGLDVDTNANATNLAWRRFNEIEGAVVVAVDDTGDTTAVNVDLSGLLGGAMITINELIEMVTEATGQSREEVVSAVREYLDQ